MTQVYFVAGTDTEVGKTVASRALIQAMAKQYQVAGYKPIASDSQATDAGLRNHDALCLLDASNCTLTYDEVNPYAYAPPISPHIAAKLVDMPIEFSKISDGLERLKTKADVVLVEGAGGWRVPVSEKATLSQWVQQEQLAVILVVGIKLGCLNHAMLTAEAIERDGLKLAGWVANRVNPGTANYAEIIEMLEDKLNAPKLGEIPYMPHIHERDLAEFIDISALPLPQMA
ncbi:ATP-dependent dethiobiotin synthetase BioD 1 [Vibrio stylophorae]|uniref:ATP-dependent dethiobiotin synthetase BioD n=1 Tax=Vibrio stylophorae TaxID=659351 RepID=A0ABM8ZU10_9VIBR|nr:dethiobiotin synthase [Vibrio stylophorae]CAH0533425.1 ATP-dependent dethiobiotin synthetase BioD 1 [Vibrio stylophorae]